MRASPRRRYCGWTQNCVICPLCALTREPSTSAAISRVAALANHVRYLRRENPASRIAHNIVQKPHRPLSRTVLVVDEAVRMVRVRLCNEPPGRSSDHHPARPAIPSSAAAPNRGVCTGPQLLHHEKPSDRASNPASRKILPCVPAGCSSSCDSMRSTWGEFCRVSNR